MDFFSLDDLQHLAKLGARLVREQREKNVVEWLGQLPNNATIEAAVGKLKTMTKLEMEENIFE